MQSRRVPTPVDPIHTSHGSAGQGIIAGRGVAAVARRLRHPPDQPADHAGRPGHGLPFQTRQEHFKDQENLVILAFSGGGTRAAAFSYGVLEFLRRTEVVGPKGNKVRLLDEVDVITGVSGGSFTALAYGLYGDKLFDDYEQRFLKRNMQGEIISRAFNPAYWAKLSSTGWGRSELAAQLYDEILFNGATFGDLDRGNGPLILASATDISTGAGSSSTSAYSTSSARISTPCRCRVRLRHRRPCRSCSRPSRSTTMAAPATDAVPPGSSCSSNPTNPPRPAARAIRELKDVEAFGDSVHRPYIHLVDGGVSDNVGMRGVLDSLEILEACTTSGVPTPLDSVRRIIVFIVNSLSSPPPKWDESESAAGHASTSCSKRPACRSTTIPTRRSNC